MPGNPLPFTELQHACPLLTSYLNWICIDKIIRLLGQGTFGKVVECLDKDTNRHCAIKIIRAVQKYRDASKIETRVLSTLKRNDPLNTLYVCAMFLVSCACHRLVADMFSIALLTTCLSFRRSTANAFTSTITLITATMFAWCSIY